MTEPDNLVTPTSRTEVALTRRRAMQGSAGMAAALLGTRRARAQEATPESDVGPALNPVVAFPAPGSRTCSPGTQIVFRGLSPDEVGPVSVKGSTSGDHSGIWIPHSDGNGASLLRDRPFEPGESVSVRTRMELRGAEEGDYQFTVSEPRFKRLEPERNEAEVEDAVRVFRSRPGLRPPIVSTTVAQEGAAEGLIFMAAKRGAGRDGAMIVDGSGELVWFLPVDLPENRIYEFRVQTWKGEPCLTWWQGLSAGGYGFGHYLIVNNRYETIAQFQAGNGYLGGDPHEFLISPQETALIIIYNVIKWDLSDVGGSETAFAVDNIVQEIEIDSGAVRFEWHCLDHIPLTDTQDEVTGEEDEELDYFHLNSVGVDFDGSIIISGRNTWSCHTVHRATGEVIWTLGGKSTDFALNDGTETAWQHDFRARPGSEYTIFDNGAAPEVHKESRGIRIALDREAMTAELVSEYVHPEGVLSRSQGNMQTLANDNLFIGWGNEPRASEFAPDGTLIQDWLLPEGKESYRSYKFPWVGAPSDPPKLAVLRDENDALNAYLSWNGDTRTTRWRLLAGSAQDQMTTRATVDRTGFETTVPVSANDLFFAAEALDTGGSVIGHSNVVAIAD